MVAENKGTRVLVAYWPRTWLVTERRHECAQNALYWKHPTPGPGVHLHTYCPGMADTITEK
jgi:hypothetical protein